MCDEKFNKFLADNGIIWQYNLSHAPWWGGQFERMIGLVKNAFYKTINCVWLTFMGGVGAFLHDVVYVAIDFISFPGVKELKPEQKL